MSNNNFNKTIKDRLYEHESDYEQGAWEKFQKLLPAPWYVGFWKIYGGWLASGLLGSMLLISYLYQNKQNELLNDEISTLNNKIELFQNASPKVVEVVKTDTLYLTRDVVQFKYINALASTQASSRIALKNDDPTAKNELKIGEKEKLVSNTTMKIGVGNNIDTRNSKVLDTPATDSRDIKNETVLAQREEEKRIIEDKKSTSLAKTAIEENSIEKKDVEAEKIKVEEAELAEALVEVKETTNSKEMKKSFRMPTIRIGLTSDYLGFNVLANGIGGEVFFNDKLSFSTGLLFSKGVESKHPLEKDFNAKTGKNFQSEFQEFNPPPMGKGIRDITIETSFLKMPLNLNYYINTWSRFKFIVSAGTKLDLAVYQDVNFISGTNSETVANRFEAKPKAQVLNNFNYGMGVQYQYGSIVAQLTPYFDYKFRNTEYFKPNKNFGIMGSLRYQLGK